METVYKEKKTFSLLPFETGLILTASPLINQKKVANPIDYKYPRDCLLLDKQSDVVIVF